MQILYRRVLGNLNWLLLIHYLMRKQNKLKGVRSENQCFRNMSNHSEYDASPYNLSIHYINFPNKRRIKVSSFPSSLTSTKFVLSKEGWQFDLPDQHRVKSKRINVRCYMEFKTRRQIFRNFANPTCIKKLSFTTPYRIQLASNCLIDHPGLVNAKVLQALEMHDQFLSSEN